MRLYPNIPDARARTVIRDLVVIGLLALFVLLGVKVHNTVDQLATLGRGVETAGTSVQSGLGGAARQVEGIPLVGNRLSESLRTAGAQTGGRTADIGRQGQQDVHHLANLLGLVVALLPSLVLLAVWVPRRARQVQTLTAGAKALKDPTNRERRALIAQRAAFGLPYGELLRHSPDPIGDLHHERYDGLVAAALEDAGLRAA